jgi:hypothetical protein
MNLEWASVAKRAGLHAAQGDRALSGLWRSVTVLRPERLKSLSGGQRPSHKVRHSKRPERPKSPREGCSPSLKSNPFARHQTASRTWDNL